MARPSQIDPRERQLVLLLKSECQRQGVSANKLAAQMKISRTTITNLFADDARPTLWVLLKLCDGLGLKLHQMLQKADEASE